MVYKEILDTPSVKASKGVFTFYSENTIKAPASVVYRALRDFQSYPNWNEYTPTVTTPSGTNDIAVGDTVTLAYRAKTTDKLMDVPCEVSVINDAEYTFCWIGRAMGIPQWLLFPEKVHKVTPKGENECLFQCYETQAGPMAYIVKWQMGELLSQYGQAMNDAFKAYVEKELNPS
ncbi:hypothetical protein PRZ48_001469 [Zasmidium cellare]|uniref:Uncharacterized protein n=1 Tax=Zasmidium cellare TaxID=395010 RepID=A0ABR0F2B6_ZASCE|nr:hypothetical protein PRZ48_001469 [Zasmidium cellare]